MHRIRLTRLLPLALALGVLITLALAWVLPAVFSGVANLHWTTGFGAANSLSTIELTRAHTPQRDVVWLCAPGRVPNFVDRVQALPAWVDPPSSWSGADRVDFEATGLPLRCFVLRAAYKAGPAFSETQVSLDGGLTVSAARDRFAMLPIHPIWPALLGNIAIWSVASLLALLVVSIARSRHRAMLGRCGECGYDLAGTPRDKPCPECGRAASQG